MATGITFRNAKIEFSDDGGSTWVDVSGETNALTVDGGEREIGTFFDAENDVPTLGAGKRSELEITMRIKYTEGTDEAHDMIGDAYEAATECAVRWTPKGAGVGNSLFTSDPGFVKSHPYPGQEVESGDPMRSEFVVVVPKITKSASAS
jgi:hypothetical protein